jgi:hypothetical protein
MAVFMLSRLLIQCSACQVSMSACVAFACGAAVVFASGFVVAWTHARPGGQVRGGRESGHVRAGLGDEDLGDAGAHPGDAVEMVDDGLKGRDLGLDALGEAGDGGLGGVDPVEHRAQTNAW